VLARCVGEPLAGCARDSADRVGLPPLSMGCAECLALAAWQAAPCRSACALGDDEAACIECTAEARASFRSCSGVLIVPESSVVDG